MGKKSRRARPLRLPPRAVDAVDAADVPVVGLREPCPCGSGKRYKLCHGRQAAISDMAVGQPDRSRAWRGEGDWVAMREVVPAATAAVAHDRRVRRRGEVTVATMLPMAWAALHRPDGALLVGLQTQGGSGDPSRDTAAALLARAGRGAGDADRGRGLPGAGPRLQDVLDPESGFDVRVREGFDFWLAEDAEQTDDVRESMERANAAVIPTERLVSVEAAYWCRIGDRSHLRWVLPHDEEPLLDAIARLHAAAEPRPRRGHPVHRRLPGARAARAGLGPRPRSAWPTTSRSRPRPSPRASTRRWPRPPT